MTLREGQPPSCVAPDHSPEAMWYEVNIEISIVWDRATENDDTLVSHFDSPFIGD